MQHSDTSVNAAEEGKKGEPRVEVRVRNGITVDRNYFARFSAVPLISNLRFPSMLSLVYSSTLRKFHFSR